MKNAAAGRLLALLPNLISVLTPPSVSEHCHFGGAKRLKYLKHVQSSLPEPARSEAEGVKMTGP